MTHFVASHPGCTTALHLDSFSVSAIPGAHGIAAKRSDGEGYDIVFADGAFSYDVGAFTTDPNGHPTRMDVVRAATASTPESTGIQPGRRQAEASRFRRRRVIGYGSGASQRETT